MIANSIKEKLTNKPVLVDVHNGRKKSQPDMLSLDLEENIEFTRQGGNNSDWVCAKSKYGEHMIGIRDRSYFANAEPVETRQIPTVVLTADEKRDVQRKRFDLIRISYKNFINVNIDDEENDWWNVLDVVNDEVEEVDGLTVNLHISEHEKIMMYPAKVERTLGTLIVEIAGKNKIARDNVDTLLQKVGMAITLHLKKPVDPESVELGIYKPDERYEGEFRSVAYEHGKKYEYSDFEMSVNETIELQKVSNLKRTIVSVLRHKENDEISSWEYLQTAKYKSYYLDAIMTIMLSMVESIYSYQKTERDESAEKYDEFMEILIQLPIDRSLMKFVRNGKVAYVDRKDYKTKLRSLVEESGVQIPRLEDFLTHCVQLRNSLMHGRKPDWEHITDKDGSYLRQINLSANIRLLEEVLGGIIKSRYDAL